MRQKKMKLRLGFLASHNGTDMRGIIAALNSGELNGTAEVVISNNAEAPALAFAKEAGIPAFCINIKTHGTAEKVDNAICQTLKDHHVNLVILSGYMKMLGPKTCAAFPEKILNVHPALLPNYAGLWGDSVHEAVLAAQEKITGVTIHTIVANEYDKGSILLQTQVPVRGDDTVETLRKRVQTAEIDSFVTLLRKML